ncbi:MAG: aminofutalosine synthase MqnE [Pirellulales bacterium]|nr:aminofutalosine synthase MqnE [Pirellulales bacterium]
MMLTQIERIRTKIESGERLTAADGEFLFRSEVDLHAVGELADVVRRRKNGNVAYYNVNAHLNPTNVCVYRCPLCAYSCNADDPRAFVMSMDEMLARGQEARDAGCTELHIVGGVHPEKKYEWYLEIIRQLHRAFPQLHLKAWTAVEIDWFSQLTGRPVESVLEEMQSAGLRSLPGGGAEIFNPEIRRQICPRKADATTWLHVHRTAHRLGLRSNATMLYGHLETTAHRIDHLLQLRQLQDKTGGFQAFVPLSFHPENTRLIPKGTVPFSLQENRDSPQIVHRTSALDDLRTVAVGRLMLDNFDHVKAYWVSLGLGTAQVALAYGADDLDGTVRRERIHHAAGAPSPEALSVEQLQNLIREAGRDPIDRDSLYQQVGVRP